jgi:hypothetical protein
MISSALYRFFGMVQISSGGFLPLSIWTSYFRLGHLENNHQLLDDYGDVLILKRVGK